MPEVSTLGARLLSVSPESLVTGRATPFYLPQRRLCVSEARVFVKEESMARKLEPLGDRIVVKAVEQDQKTKSGIYIPDSAKERPQEGKVIAVGPGRLDDDGKRVPMDIKKGDTIIYSKFGGTEFEEDGEEYLIMKESEVLAKVA